MPTTATRAELEARLTEIKAQYEGHRRFYRDEEESYTDRMHAIEEQIAALPPDAPDAPRGRGRPALGLAKRQRVLIYLSPAERAQLDASAGDALLGFGEWCRSALLRASDPSL